MPRPGRTGRVVVLFMLCCCVATTHGGCGDDDGGSEQAESAPRTEAAGALDGAYVAVLTPRAARKIPRPDITAGEYRLSITKGSYSLGSTTKGPCCEGTVTLTRGRAVFGRDFPPGPCRSSGTYRLTEAAGTLEFELIEDGCEDFRPNLLPNLVWREE